MWRHAGLLVLILWPLLGTGAPLTTVRHAPAPPGDSLLHRYYVDMLALALERTRRDFGPYRLKEIGYFPTQRRLLHLIRRGRDLDVGWAMTSTEREARLQPVRIPLFKGLMGYRLLLIHRDNRNLFRHLENLDQLRHLTAGQALNWTDVAILRANDLPVVTSAHYRPLFPMLEQQRYDYFPRGVTEAFGEQAAYGSPDLVVAPRIALHYPTAMYFFVGKHNPALAHRLETGLRRALADGSFDRLLDNHPGTGPSLRKATLGERHIIELSNPLLPETTPLADPRLWQPVPGHPHP